MNLFHRERQGDSRSCRKRGSGLSTTESPGSSVKTLFDGVLALEQGKSYNLSDYEGIGPFALYADGKKYQFRILQGCFFIGRSALAQELYGPSADYLAIRQARIKCEGDRLYIQSCGACNPNYVNGKLLTDELRELWDGDTLELSTIKLVVSKVRPMSRTTDICVLENRDGRQ